MRFKDSKTRTKSMKKWILLTGSPRRAGQLFARQIYTRKVADIVNDEIAKIILLTARSDKGNLHSAHCEKRQMNVFAEHIMT